MSGTSSQQSPAGGLRASNLCCRRGHKLLFDSLDLRIGPGEFHELRGDNGSGKTTLLKILAGFLAPDTGQVTWTDSAGQQQSRVGSALHYLGHELALKPYLTVAENIRFSAGYLGAESPETAVEKAGALGLSDLLELPVKYLSQGQKRRTALIRLLAVPRPVWLLDEPNVGLDAPSRERFAHLMQAHLDDGGLILASTHQSLGIAPTAVLTLGGAP